MAMKTMMRLVIAAAALAAPMCFDVPASRAFGDAPWCAVKNLGSDVSWDCEYRSVEECAPNVVAGDRGFCNINPAWRGPATPAAAAHHRKRRVQEH
jgi:hypothetical protein